MAPNTDGILSSAMIGPSSSGGFKLGRGDTTMFGFSPGVDERVARELADLDELLSRRIVDGTDHRDTLRDWTRLKLRPRRHGARPRSGSGSGTKSAGASSKPEPWEPGTLAAVLAAQREGSADETVAEVLDADRELAVLRYRFDAKLADRWNELDPAQRTVLGHRGIRDLLIARAALSKGVMNPEAALNFVLTSSEGVAQVAEYALLGAARAWVAERNLRIPDIDKDDGPTLKALSGASLSMSETSFEPEVEELIEGRIENSKYDSLIAKAQVTWLPPEMKERLYDKIKSSPVPVTEANAAHVIPLYAAQVASSSVPHPAGSPTGDDDPFRVIPFVEDSSQLQVSTAAVKCASQLYYVMTLGDELGVFDAVRFFTHRYLFRDGFAVEDRTLRRDLENYVFSEQFPGYDEESGEHRFMHTTQDAERRSFYRQVFDLGNEPVPGDGMANSEFHRHWKILMLESARYLERAQASPNPGSYVSKQNVMQAVEDLQYNLSTSCVGMATVMTPLMYAELDFVVRRILGHEEVRRHLVPAGGSWWKVVEKLAAAQGRRTRASVLHNKARQGYSLIRMVANYTPSQFEQDDVFSQFISNVDAFITTQSILQEDDSDSLLTEPDENGGGGPFPGMPSIPGLSDLPGMPGMPGVPGMPSLQGVGANGSSSTRPAADDWDF